MIIVFIIQGHRIETSAVSKGRTQPSEGRTKFNSKKKLSPGRDGAISGKHQRNSERTSGKASLHGVPGKHTRGHSAGALRFGTCPVLVRCRPTANTNHLCAVRAGQLSEGLGGVKV